MLKLISVGFEPKTQKTRMNTTRAILLMFCQFAVVKDKLISKRTEMARESVIKNIE